MSEGAEEKEEEKYDFATRDSHVMQPQGVVLLHPVLFWVWFCRIRFCYMGVSV